MRTNKIPKALQKVLDANSDKIRSYHMEQDDFPENEHSSWSIWVNLNSGYLNPYAECPAIHEHDAKEAIMMVRSIIKL